MNCCSTPLCFVGSLFVAWYLFDYSVVGFGVGSDLAVAADNFVLWRAVVVLLVASLSGHSKLYWLVATLLVAVVWVAHLICASGSASNIAQSYSLWLAIRASGGRARTLPVWLRPTDQRLLRLQRCLHTPVNALGHIHVPLYRGTQRRRVNINKKKSSKNAVSVFFYLFFQSKLSFGGAPKYCLYLERGGGGHLIGLGGSSPIERPVRT